MKELGKAQKVLGIRIRQEKRTEKLDQANYVNVILNTFKITGCKAVTTPMSTDQRLTKSKGQHYTQPENIAYQELAGSLMYLAVCTRPDIANVIRILSQFNSCYSVDHWHATKPVFRYLEWTINYALVHSKSDIFLEHHDDADFASNINDGKSISGFVLKLSNCHFVTEKVLEGMIVLKYLNTNEMLADILTKLPKGKFSFCPQQIGIEKSYQL
jgi:hypothetical protein